MGDRPAQPFRAFRIHTDGGRRSGIEALTLDELGRGEVLVEAHYCSVNYKDALAGTGLGKILRRSPGDRLLVTGCGMGAVHDGGYAEYLRVPADWVVPPGAKSGPVRGHGDRQAWATSCWAGSRAR
jgi:acrylyl-CoA reductase (NADPH)